MSQNSELLSAYLDDQLRPAERGKVEQLLAADPDAPAQLEALRRVARGVSHLERQAPPVTLDLKNVRRLAALRGEERSLFDQIEDQIPVLARQSTLLLLFSLIVAFGLLIYSFSVWQWQDPKSMLPVKLDPPPEITVTQDYHQGGHTALVSGKVFLRQDGIWYQEGYGPDTEARPVTLDGGEGRRLLERRADLRGISRLGEVVLEVDGEVLCLIPADRPLGGL